MQTENNGIIMLQMGETLYRINAHCVHPYNTEGFYDEVVYLPSIK